MTWKVARDVLEKKKSEEANSVLEARALFLSLLLHLLPDVAADLWSKAFLDFLYIVADRFKHELLGKQAKTVDSGNQVLDHLLAEATAQLKTGEDFNPNKESIACLAVARFKRIDSDQLKAAFPDWNSLINSNEIIGLKTRIHEWSVRWNLNADWCRDHALAVLCEWAVDETLRWAFLPVDTHSQLQRNGWQRATTARIWHVQCSRLVDGLRILNGNLKSFEFAWRGAGFDAPGWNYLKQKERDWRLRTKLKFCVWLSEEELESIGPLADDAASNELTSAEIDKALGWRHGALTKFEAAMRAYLGRMRLLRQAAKSQHQLVEVDDKPKLQEHIEWTVRYQVGGGEGLSQIASSIRQQEGGLQASTVARAVEEVLPLIGLVKRPDPKPKHAMPPK
jgi:hypothetical protein